MKRVAAGEHHAAYEFGRLALISLRDGYVDMPVTRLRQPGDRPFGPDLPPQLHLVEGGLRHLGDLELEEGDELLSLHVNKRLVGGSSGCGGGSGSSSGSSSIGSGSKSASSSPDKAGHSHAVRK